MIFTSRSIDLETIASYAKYGNIVCLEKVNHSQLSSVYVDRKPACREAFRWLKELGYQHLALVFTRKDKRSSTYRMVREAYDEVYGLEHEPVIIEGVAIEEDAYQKASELWQHLEIDCIQMEMTWQQALCRLMKKLENSSPSSWGKKTCWLDGSWVSLP